MNKRRCTSLLLAGLLMLPLAACGKKDPGEASSPPPPEPTVSVIVPVEPEPEPEPQLEPEPAPCSPSQGSLLS